MTSHWDRTRPQFFAIDELPWQQATEPKVLHGLAVRLLSRDPASGDSTLLARLPAGWRHSYDAGEATLELFVLEGDLAVNGERVGSTGYAFVPRDSGTSELRSEAGAQALVFWHPELALAAAAAIRVARIWEEPWQGSVMTNLGRGVMHKSLRAPDLVVGDLVGNPSGALRLVQLPPGFVETREHKHEIWEEIIFLAGDWLMPSHGQIGPGSYVGNPAGHWHGPIISQRGSVQLSHFLAPVGMTPRQYPRGAELAAEYLDATSWLEPPRHGAWADVQQQH